MDDAAARDIVLEALGTYDPQREPQTIEPARVPVSTNRVYRLTFASRPSIFAKLSSYGSFVHFRQDPRFRLFLDAYQSECPIGERELRFAKEAYRFFILNYVVLSGQYFFQPEICARLVREAVELYLPELERIELDDALVGRG